MQVKRKKILIICIEVVVLVIILCIIVAIGIYLYNSNTGSISNMPTTVKQNPIQKFNNQFMMYSDKQIGRNVCALVQTIISSNRRYVEEGGEYNGLVSIKYNGSGDELEDMHIIPEENDIKQKEMLELIEIIDKEQHYYIDFQKGDNELVEEVVIN